MQYIYYLVDSIDDEFFVINIKYLKPLEAIEYNKELRNRNFVRRWILSEKDGKSPLMYSVRNLGKIEW